MNDHTHNGHPSEEDLVLLFYGDTNTEEEARLSAHLETCLTCQPAWQELRSTLNTVDAAAVPEPPADFECVMWARVQGAIDGMAAPRTPWWAPRHWMPAAALAAVFVAMFMVGRLWPIASVLTPEVTADVGSQPERALLVAMDDHLERSELLLVEVMNAPETDAVRVRFERETADDLLSSSRLYRQTATQTGNVQLATMLEDLERVLVEIARAPETLKREDLDALRTRIEQDDLIFKVRVVKTSSLASEGNL